MKEQLWLSPALTPGCSEMHCISLAMICFHAPVLAEPLFLHPDYPCLRSDQQRSPEQQPGTRK